MCGVSANFDRMNEPRQAITPEHAGVDVVDFVDDLLGSEDCEEDAWTNMEALVPFLTSVVVPVSAKKSGLNPLNSG